MERVDGDEDVSHIRVNLIASIAALKLLCDRVLEGRKKNKKRQAWFTHPVWNVSQTNEHLDQCQNRIMRHNRPCFSVRPASSRGLVTPVTSIHYLHVRRWLILLSSHGSGQVHQQQHCLSHTSRSPHSEGWVEISAGNWDWLYHSIRQCSVQIW